MARSLTVNQVGAHYAVVNLGAFTNLYDYQFEATESALSLEGKVFLKDVLQLTGAEISLNSLRPKKSLLFYHKHHRNEEIYLFLAGEGEFQVDGDIFAVAQGSVVRVAPEGERCLRNCSAQADLQWIVVQVRLNSFGDRTIQDGYAVSKRVRWRREQQA